MNSRLHALVRAVVATASFAGMLAAQGGFSGPGRYSITSARSGRVIDLDRNDQTTVIQFENRGTNNQQWDVIPAGGGWFYIRNGMNGFALEAMGDRNSTPLRANPFNGSPTQQWRFDPGKDGNALIINRNGRTIDLPNGTRDNGARLQIYGPNGDSNQRWIFTRLAGAPPDRRFDRDGDRRYDRDDDRRYDRDADRREERFGPAPGRRYFDRRDQMWKYDGDGVCFYRERDYRGPAFCAGAGQQVDNVGPDFNDTFSSVKFFGRVRGVEIFEDFGYRGERLRLDGDERDFDRLRGPRGRSWMRRVSAFRVF